MENIGIEKEILFGGQLGYLTPLQSWKHWKIMCSDTGKQQFHDKVIYQLTKYILPVFEKCHDMARLTQDVIQQGGKWSEYDKEHMSIAQVFAYGGSLEDG